MRMVLGALTAALAVATATVTAPSAQAARSPWHVTLRAKLSIITLGDTVWFTGHVNKSAAGHLVRLYGRRTSDQPWHYTRNALVRRDGSYATFDKPALNHERQYRVVLPATKKHRRGVSPTVTVDVYKWTSLTTLAAVNQVDFDPVASVAMDGTTYPSSLEAQVYHYEGAPTSQTVEFNLGHACTAFRGTFGLSDDSVSGSQATLTASADGTPWLSQSFSVGQTVANSVTWDTPPLKLHFDSVSTVDGVDGQGAVGTPEVLCELR